MNRPFLTKESDPESFQKFYYIKEELVEFCRTQGLSTQGNKLEITQRILHFLRTGQELLYKPVKKNKNNFCVPIIIIEEAIIEGNFKCTQQHRQFFKAKIGKGFKFNVPFQKWLKENSGKTYKEAICAYEFIKENKSPKTIDKQFEYNRYIRDFFYDNKQLKLKDAILCWKYKKSLPGHNKYQKTDIKALK